MVWGKNLEQIYHQTANLIFDYNYKYNITEEEKIFLLNLLELAIYKKDKPQFLAALKQWITKYDNSETDQIIKATLLAIDWSDEKSLLFNIQLITELINGKGELSQGGADNE